jgi:hypothetical protein
MAFFKVDEISHLTPRHVTARKLRSPQKARPASKSPTALEVSRNGFSLKLSDARATEIGDVMDNEFERL